MKDYAKKWLPLSRPDFFPIAKGYRNFLRFLYNASYVPEMAELMEKIIWGNRIY
jgi:hypothetical protein